MVPDTTLYDMQAAQENQLEMEQEDLLLTYSMWDPQVVLRKCKRKRRLAARKKREEELLSSSSEHSSDEEYIRPPYVRTRVNRPSIARIEAEKERLYSELEKCKRKLALAKKQCAARKEAELAATPPIGPSVGMRPTFPHGRPVIPIFNASRPMMRHNNPGKPMFTRRSLMVSTPKLTVKGPKRTYASKRGVQMPQHPVCEQGWVTSTSAAGPTVISDTLLRQAELFKRQRSLTVNANLPETTTTNLPRFFSNQMQGNNRYPQHPSIQIPFSSGNVVYNQFDPRALNHASGSINHASGSMNHASGSLNHASSSLNSMIIMPTYQHQYAQGIQQIQQLHPDAYRNNCLPSNARMWGNFVQNGHINQFQNRIPLTHPIPSAQFTPQHNLSQDINSPVIGSGGGLSIPHHMQVTIPNYGEAPVRGNISAPRYLQLSLPQRQVSVFPQLAHQVPTQQARLSSNNHHNIPRFITRTPNMNQTFPMATDQLTIPFPTNQEFNSPSKIISVPPTAKIVDHESSNSTVNLQPTPP